MIFIVWNESWPSEITNNLLLIIQNLKRMRVCIPVQSTPFQSYYMRLEVLMVVKFGCGLLGYDIL
jgi:hypothetical protein